MASDNPLLRALTRERQAKGISKADSLVRSFSITEKVIFIALMVVFAAAVLSLIGKISDGYSITVPEHGGELVEGIVGTPRFINPLLAVSDADRDLSALVYAGLLRRSSDGSLVPDLASDYSISPDGLSYTVHINPKAMFQDGSSVTADDVAFTVQMAQDPSLKSPLRVSWEGVTVEKVDEHTVVFHLKQAYAPFIDDLTDGILPAHIWKSLTSDQMPFSALNLSAVGAGPYEIGSVTKGSDGIPNEILLKSNASYILGEPYIGSIRLRFYQNEDDLVSALESGAVASASNLSPESAAKVASNGSSRIITAPLSRVFAVFFNQSQNELLAHKEVRQALSMVIDKDALIRDVLHGYGTVTDGPLPPTVAQKASFDASVAAATASSTQSDGGLSDGGSAGVASSTIGAARAVLAKGGWKLDADTGFLVQVKGKGKSVSTTTLSVSLSTADIPELVLAGKKIQEAWQALGVDASLRVFEPSDLNQSVIRPRRYDALLFGLVTGDTSDLYPFWHSSQRVDPGLNVALYTNHAADKLLERMRLATSTAEFSSEYAQFKADIDADLPAIFLWSPDFIYAVPANLHGIKLGEITTSSDRFAGIDSWYVATDRVWSVFSKGDGII